MRDPQTRSEWQDAVDAAHGASLLDSARKYGLVTGGPEVDVGRCDEILARGAAAGIVPRPDALDRFIAEGMKQYRRWPKARQNGR